VDSDQDILRQSPILAVTRKDAEFSQQQAEATFKQIYDSKTN
jgi:hypothetical protein